MMRVNAFSPVQGGGDVIRGGASRNNQQRGYLSVRAPARDQLHHLALTLSQLVNGGLRCWSRVTSALDDAR